MFLEENPIVKSLRIWKKLILKTVAFVLLYFKWKVELMWALFTWEKTWTEGTCRVYVCSVALDDSNLLLTLDEMFTEQNFIQNRTDFIETGLTFYFCYSEEVKK